MLGPTDKSAGGRGAGAVLPAAMPVRRGQVFWSGRIDGTTLQSHLIAKLRTAPDKSSLAFVDARCGFEWRSRHDVYEGASQWAATLLRRGVKPGDVCVLVLPGGEPAVLPLLGTLFAGAVPLLVAPPTLQGRNSSLGTILSRTLRTAKARLAILGDGLEALGAELGRRDPTLIVTMRRELAGDAD